MVGWRFKKVVKTKNLGHVWSFLYQFNKFSAHQSKKYNLRPKTLR